MSNGQTFWPVTPRRIAARNDVSGRRLQRIWLGANLCVSLFSSYAYSREVLLREGQTNTLPTKTRAKAAKWPVSWACARW